MPSLQSVILNFDIQKPVWSHLTNNSLMQGHNLAFSVNVMKSCSLLRDVSQSRFTTFYTEFNKQHQAWQRASLRGRGNPLGVLWVICWCGTWALKHPGSLQQHEVTVMLSSFSVTSTSANRSGCETTACRNDHGADSGTTVSSLIPD